MSERILVLGADHRQSAAIVRSLARAGYDPVIGRERQRRSFIEWSRYVRRVWAHPDLADAGAFHMALLEALTAGEFDRIVPVGEKQLRVLAECDGVPAERVLAPDPKALACCLDKREAWKAAAAASVPVPAQAVAKTFTELLLAARDVGFPCVIKPGLSSTEFFGQKALICADEDAISRTLRDWCGDCASLVVQRFVRGVRHNCNVIAHEGRLTHYCEVVVCRTDRADGTGYCVDGVTVPPTPELLADCTRLLDRLRYSGPAGIQFLVDPATGERVFLEINPRFDAAVAVPCHAGFDLPRYAVEQMRTPPAPTVSPLCDYEAGVRVHWLSGDVAGLIRALRHRDVGVGSAVRWIGQMVRSLVRARRHVVIDREDPRPALALSARLLRAALTR